MVIETGGGEWGCAEALAGARGSPLAAARLNDRPEAALDRLEADSSVDELAGPDAVYASCVVVGAIGPQQSGEGAVGVECAGSDEFCEAAQADVVGAAGGGLGSIGVDACKVLVAGGVRSLGVSASCFLGLVPELGNSGGCLDPAFGRRKGVGVDDL